MHGQFILTAMAIGFMLCQPATNSWGRGFGGGAHVGRGIGGAHGGLGGGLSGGPHGGFGGGGPSLGGHGPGGRSPNFGGHGPGGAGPSLGGAHGPSAPNFGGRSPGAGVPNFGGRSPSAGVPNFGGRNPGAGVPNFGGRSPGAGVPNLAGRSPGAGVPNFGGAAGLSGTRNNLAGAAPNRTQLGDFLGMPSDGGLHNLNSSANLGNNFDVNRAAAAGPRGGVAAGASVTGPAGNTAYRGAASGPLGGTTATRGVQGTNGAGASQRAAIGPRGTVAAGGEVHNGYGAGAAQGAAVGRYGAAGGFARVSPAGRYSSAVAVRGNFDHWDNYGSGWYTAHPGAWAATGWAAGSVWRAATWNSIDDWFGYDSSNPVYYDYGNTVTYQDNSVYVNGQDMGTTDQYYDQADQLATAGAKSNAPEDGDWLPLGVFALTKKGQTKPNVTVQLAVNKQGVIRGNYTDNNDNTSQVIQGSVDKKTQRVAFTVGSNTTNVIETGLYNLTKDEAPCLLHFGKSRTEQWDLVRLKNPKTSSSK